MNWHLIFADLLKLSIFATAGVNAVHAEKDSATKVQMAQDALQIATAGALQVIPSKDDATAQAVSNAVATVIAATQAVHDSAAKTTTAATTTVEVP